jgi:hypothetical protein
MDFNGATTVARSFKMTDKLKVGINIFNRFRTNPKSGEKQPWEKLGFASLSDNNPAFVNDNLKAVEAAYFAGDLCDEDGVPVTDGESPAFMTIICRVHPTGVEREQESMSFTNVNGQVTESTAKPETAVKAEEGQPDIPF